MLNRFRRNKRNKYQYGGKVEIDFPMPEVQHGTTQDALKANTEATKEANKEQVAMNKSGGGDIVVPQLGSAAGEAGNDEIADQISLVNQGKADTEFDKDAPVVPKPKATAGGHVAEKVRKLKKKRGGCGCDKGGKRKTRKRRRKKGGHCGNHLKIVKKLLNRTKKNRTKKNIKKLKKQMKILTRKIKDYNNPRKRLKKNKSHIRRYRKIRSQFKRLI